MTLAGKDAKPAAGALTSAAALVLILVSLWMIAAYAPVERTMGMVQKIFYFHVPSAWCALLSFFLVFVAGMGYLASRRPGWDHLAIGAAEVGVLFCTLALITGAIWGRAAWGVWWAWESRLTSTLILWLIYVGYLALRHFSEPGERTRRLAAVLGIVGFIDVPLVYFSVRWWRTLHPGHMVVTSGGFGAGLEPRMLHTLMTALAGFTLLLVSLILVRVSLERMMERCEQVATAAGDPGSY